MSNPKIPQGDLLPYIVPVCLKVFAAFMEGRIRCQIDGGEIITVQLRRTVERAFCYRFLFLRLPGDNIRSQKGTKTTCKSSSGETAPIVAITEIKVGDGRRVHLLTHEVHRKLNVWPCQRERQWSRHWGAI